MNSPVNVERLRREMFVCGLDESELAAMAKVSGATITSMLAGKSVQMTTLYRVAAALKQRPALPELEIASPHEPDATGQPRSPASNSTRGGRRSAPDGPIA